MVQRDDSDWTLRRGPDRRRRFRISRRRNDLRQGAGAGRGALRGAFSGADRAATLHKSDRLPPPNESTASRNIVRVSTVARVGNRDVMRVRPFVRIAGNLSMTTSDLSAKIPPFNAQRLLTDVGSDPKTAAEDPNNPEAVEPDAEVSFVTKDLSPVLPKAKISAVVALDDILMRVRDAANWRGNGGVRYASLANAAADISGATGPLRHQNRLRLRSLAVRSLCRLRDARGTGKRHAAAQDKGADHRRQSQRRTRPSGQEGRQRRRRAARSRRERR